MVERTNKRRRRTARKVELPSRRKRKITDQKDKSICPLAGRSQGPEMSLIRHQGVITPFLDDPTVGDVELILYAGGGFATLPPKPNTNYATIINSLSHPYSRGSVHIQSTNVTTQPVINPNIFQVAFDKKALVEVFRLSREIMHSEPLKELIHSSSTPGPTVDTEAEWTEYIIETTQPNYHGIGTAILAPRNIGGVVSPELKVYGTSNLRVADGSVIPLHFATHPASTIYAIAEKAANLILSSD